MSNTSTINVGSKVFVPDAQNVWVAAEVRSVNLPMVKVDTANGAQTINMEDSKVIQQLKSVGAQQLPLQNEDVNVEDMTELNYLHEAAILQNLRTRFLAESPYTYTGEICIAVNPYQRFNIYNEETQKRYLQADSKSESPHVYSTSARAYKRMREMKENQSILVSGESGAGKTETTKILMGHMAAISKIAGASSDDKTITAIIQANPLLETFGNAKTTRNDNSSRFGKLTRLQFDSDGLLRGAISNTYLLEKTRILSHTEGERNYHIFYQVLAAAEQGNHPEFKIDAKAAYRYLCNSSFEKIEGKTDYEHYQETKQALDIINVTEEEQHQLFSMIAAVLHLGQIKLEAKGDDESEIAEASKAELEIFAELVGRDAADVAKCLTTRTVKCGGDCITKGLPLVDAEACRDALATAIYTAQFNWLVNRINKAIGVEDATGMNTISILDIFGFEHFEHNSYEQLCINYANEKLQQKFTSDVFKTVQQEYAAEAINWDHITFSDNQECLDLIESKLGLISLLNEEMTRPGGNDKAFVSKMNSNHGKLPFVSFPKTNDSQFTIDHYAGKVTYDATGFLGKHKDTLLPDLEALMQNSDNTFVQALFAKPKPQQDEAQDGKPLRRKRGKSSASSVGTQFKVSLASLMEEVGQTNVQYVRCIKPNSNKSTTEFNMQMSVDQLRCAGVIEAIKMSRSAYPNRISHAECIDRFNLLLGDDANTNVEKIMSQQGLKSPDQYQIGKTKVYFQQGVLEKLEEQRVAEMEKVYGTAAIQVQRIARGFVQQRKYQCALASNKAAKAATGAATEATAKAEAAAKAVAEAKSKAEAAATAEATAKAEAAAKAVAEAKSKAEAATTAEATAKAAAEVEAKKAPTQPTKSPKLETEEQKKARELVEASLPTGWTTRWSKSEGRAYYACRVLKITQWERPTQCAIPARG